MHPNQAFRTEDRALMETLIDEIGFGMVFATTPDGPRVAHTSQWGGTRVTPSFSAQWQHEFLDDQLPFEARFANDPSRLFTVQGPKIGRDSVLITAGLNIAWSRYAVYLAYQADLGRKNYESQSALIGCRVSW